MGISGALLGPTCPSSLEALGGDLFAATVDGATADLVASFPGPIATQGFLCYTNHEMRPGLVCVRFVLTPVGQGLHQIADQA